MDLKKIRERELVIRVTFPSEKPFTFNAQESFKKSFRIEMGKDLTLLTTFRLINRQRVRMFFKKQILLSMNLKVQ